MGKGVVATVGDELGLGRLAALCDGKRRLDGLRPAAGYDLRGGRQDRRGGVPRKDPLGLIAMRDEPRKDATDAVRQLKAMGVSSVILTGDNPRTAAAIAGGLGMEFQADMMPEDKLEAIRDDEPKGAA